MRIETALDDLFLSRSHIKILRALNDLPEGAVASIREISRRAGVTHPTASGVLDALREVGLVTVRRTPRADEYRLATEHVLVEPLRAFLRTERELPSLVREHLRAGILAEAPWVRAAWLFGSAATGDMSPQSDLDVALICPAGREAELEAIVETLSEQTRRLFGNRIHPLVGSRTLADLSRRGGAWRAVREEGSALLDRREAAAG